MNFPLKTAIAAFALTTAMPAIAAITFSDPTDPASLIAFDGTEPGTSATLLLDLTGNTGGLFTFDYTLTNTSDAALNPQAVISSFGFNDIGVSTTTGSVDGAFTNIIFGGSGPGPFNGIEVCFNNSGGGGNGCSGPGGVAVGDSGMGTFTLQYGADVTSLTLSDFGVRYQSLGLDGEGSGTGVEIPVPEPSTWAMALLGFGAAGYAVRRRRKSMLTQLA